MKLTIVLFFLFFISHSLHAQNDFVLLKKKGYTIGRFFTGSPVKVYTKNNTLYEGYVSVCKNDSIFIHLGYMGLVPTMFGSTIDTIFLGYIPIAVKDISLIPAKRISAADAGNTIFKLAFIGLGVALVNQFNIRVPTIYLVQFVSGVAINFGAQFIKPFRNKRPKGYRIGKKYTLEYIHLSAPK